MDDIEGIKSLLSTSNVAIIKKLYFYESDKTKESIIVILNEMIDKQRFYNDTNMTEWLLDNIEFDPKILNWMFESLIKTDKYSLPSQINNSPAITKLINLGAHITTTETHKNYKLIHDGLIFLSKDDFFNYVSKHGFVVNTQNIKPIFYSDGKITPYEEVLMIEYRTFVDKNIYDYLYNLWIQQTLHIDDIYEVLRIIFGQNYEAHENVINSLISIAHSNNVSKELAFCLTNHNINRGIPTYFEKYDFFGEIEFLQKVSRTMRYRRRSDFEANDPELDELLGAISANAEANRLYKIIIDNIGSYRPSEIIYDDEIKNVISLKNIVEKK
uniref:Uncharacterized protein n=1 Tax=viral metagenome TaxID=1070528 RepID=A0A6C0C9F0_9ZZZZ